jgi:hypothetical protein
MAVQMDWDQGDEGLVICLFYLLHHSHITAESDRIGKKDKQSGRSSHSDFANYALFREKYFIS